ncbi:phage tail tube protein [Caudoviricetes sp.]|nr:phage tail tube protein [Caudoviricetes sp.]
MNPLINPKANERGELTLQVGDDVLHMKLTFGTVMRLESSLDKSMLAVSQEFAARTPRITDVVAVIWSALIGAKQKNRATGEDYTLNEVGDIAEVVGLPQLMIHAGTLVAAYLSGGKSAAQVTEGKA